MAGSINKVILVGNLGADPDIRETKDGRAIVNLSVATSESWRDKETGEKREKTEWHRVVIFSERLGKVAEKYLRKGSKAYLEGRLKTRRWRDRLGQDHYTTEVVLQGFGSNLTILASQNDSGQPKAEAQAEAYGQPPSKAPQKSKPPGFDQDDPRTHRPIDDLNDEIPF